jgi:hypothetical protein
MALISNTDFNDLTECEKIGRSVYKSNPHFQKLAHFMENPVTREIYDEHFGDKNSLTCWIMFLKVYEEVEMSSTVELTAYQKICLVKKLFDDRKCRHAIAKGVQKWQGSLLSIEEPHTENNIPRHSITLTHTSEL